MAKDRLDEFELFYQEIPVHQEYLEETEIEDLVEDESTATSGLTDDQVVLLAQDALPTREQTTRDRATTSGSEGTTEATSQTLF